MMLKHIELTYRSFECQKLSDIGELAILIGPNNAGKSTILSALLWLSDVFRNNPDGYSAWQKMAHGFVSLLDGTLKIELPLSELYGKFNLFPKHQEYQIGFRFGSSSPPHYYFRHVSDSSVPPSANIFQNGQWCDAPAVHGQGGIDNLSITEILKQCRVPAEMMESSRKEIQKNLADFFRGFFYLSHNRDSIFDDEIKRRDCLDSKAAHLASRLDQLISEQRSIFREKIDNFLNIVVPGIGHIVTNRKQNGDQATVSISFDNGKHRIPLQDLGGGVTHVLSIALILLGEPNARLLMIEEPESHLHEGAQRRLIEQIIAHKGTKQIVISTHSPIFMDKTMASSVYSVTKLAEQSIIEKKISNQGQYEILDQLGVHPSSLLQTNCIIWIEGPTERILIKHWISLWDAELKENEHYSFVMTAGTLLDDYAIGPPAKDQDFTDMLKICRRSFIVADRDTAEDMPPSKKAVQRLKSEMEKINSNAIWVTDDYEIEWYYPRVVLSNLWDSIDLDKLEASRTEAIPFYEALNRAATAVAKVKSASTRKTHWASLAIQNSSKDDWFGTSKDNKLSKRIGFLAQYIRDANPSLRGVSGKKNCPACDRPIP